MERLGKFYESDYSGVPNACGHFPSSLPNESRYSNSIVSGCRRNKDKIVNLMFNRVSFFHVSFLQHFAFEEIEESGISLHVNSVIRNYLAVNDQSLYQHLKKLNIPYTVFGM